MNHPRPILGQILQKIAPKIGAEIVLEPEWGIVGQIVFANGRKRYFRYSSIDLNPLGASEIAKDKGFANFFMKEMGYPTIEGDTFFSEAWATAIGSTKGIDDAIRYAESLGFPVIVKPNSGSQGVGVTLVHTSDEMYRAMMRIFERDRVALVQRPVTGKDYRIVVLDDRVISAYERIPLNVFGDGDSSVRELLAEKQSQFVASSRDTQLNVDDPRIAEKLQRSGRSLDSIPEKGECIFLLDNANLSSGGDSVDVTNETHPFFAEMAIRLTADMGLRLCGVDVMIDGDITNASSSYRILEVNAAPGLDHYAKTGAEQEKIIEDMYLEVLKSLA